VTQELFLFVLQTDLSLLSSIFWGAIQILHPHWKI
jgi:hypothetical protein